jgi:hypothetical protein
MEENTPIGEKLCDGIKTLTIKEPSTFDDRFSPEVRAIYDRIIQKQKKWRTSYLI